MQLRTEDAQDGPQQKILQLNVITLRLGTVAWAPETSAQPHTPRICPLASNTVTPNTGVLPRAGLYRVLHGLRPTCVCDVPEAPTHSTGTHTLRSRP